MSFSYYDITIPVFIKFLSNMHHILSKVFFSLPFPPPSPSTIPYHTAETHFTTTSQPLTTLTSTRLAPDMYDLTFQIHAICANALNSIAPLPSGYIVPCPVAVSGSSLFSLLQKLSSTIEELKEAKKEDVDLLVEEKDTNFMVGKKAFRFETRKGFLLGFLLPNWWFHMGTAYAIVRSRGVEVGKGDWMAGGTGVIGV
ncbi:MAG: hypothetical protein M1820_005482 [Bogoriella megaspora]|nr:MAG: hypothetical protein M1820_005482 [Bogoriella megaspora]